MFAAKGRRITAFKVGSALPPFASSSELRDGIPFVRERQRQLRKRELEDKLAVGQRAPAGSPKILTGLAPKGNVHTS
jgi:hypothetical protein